MNEGFTALLLTAVSIGFFHTLMGPDHYIPFVMMSRAGKWSTPKTLFVTFLCGIGHVLSSIILGVFGLILGIAVFKLERIESFRGDLAAWALIIFGALYFAWGVKRAIKGKSHKHLHLHEGNNHQHTHNHFGEHTHIHEDSEKSNMTPWVLFTIFIFGPCEPLIPLLMYPAAKGNVQQVLAVCTAFSIVTISTMMIVVIAGVSGLKTVSVGWIDKYTHALSGLAIFFCGIAIKFLGL